MTTSTQVLYAIGGALVGHYGGFGLWLCYMIVGLYIACKTSGE